jgi:fumarylacetoacetase
MPQSSANPTTTAASSLPNFTDPTLAPNLRTWVESANDPASDFPIQNLPLGLVEDEEGTPLLVVRVGDSLVLLDLLIHSGALADDGEDGELPDDHPMHILHAAAHHGMPLPIMQYPSCWSWARKALQKFLLDGPAGGQQMRRLREKAVRPVSEFNLVPPVWAANYTDFYASIHHAKTVGSMFRPENPLLPNYRHVPIGYHGRSSSLVGSGTEIRRPMGQTKADTAESPTFGPSQRLDYELELGCVIAGQNDVGDGVTIDEAPGRIFGFVLVNDWSARDMQAWEYQPLGPFLAKNFATSVSPWIVTAEALAPFRTTGPARDAGEPQPLEYLRGSGASTHWNLDMHLEVLIASESMRKAGTAPVRISLANFKDCMYWNFPQLITHHGSNGCNLMPGDLLASGTISGPDMQQRGCLLERTWAGHGPDGKPAPRQPIMLPTGEKRIFLEDGDEVIMRAWCQRDGYRRIGLGEVRNIVVPAKARS